MRKVSIVSIYCGSAQRIQASLDSSEKKVRKKKEAKKVKRNKQKKTLASDIESAGGAVMKSPFYLFWVGMQWTGWSIAQ